MRLSINEDRRRLALVEGGTMAWLPSPQQGVERRMLERSGDEVADATTIVRYARRSRFPAHTHELGEEFLVLSGTFSDEHGDYPAGTYVRNPPGSAHAPHSDGGCVILVKLRQMRADESECVRVYPGERAWRAQPWPGVDSALLYANARIQVSLLRLAPGAGLPERRRMRGEEMFVIEGTVDLLTRSGQTLHPWAWRRSAERRQPAMRSAGGALLWLKRGHL